MKAEGYGLWLIFKEIWVALIFAMFGGFVEMMARRQQEPLSVRMIISTFVTAAFIGMIVALLLYEMDSVPIAAKGAMIGASGASARSLLKVVQKWGGSVVRRILGDTNDGS